MKNQIKQFEKILSGYDMGLRRNGSGHLSVIKDGKHVATLSHSPSDPHFVRQTIRVLVRKGHLPESCKRIKV